VTFVRWAARAARSEPAVMEAPMDTTVVKQTVIVGSPELAVFIEARDGCAEADLAGVKADSTVKKYLRVGHVYLLQWPVLLDF
jgi:hypothetical protein